MKSQISANTKEQNHDQLIKLLEHQWKNIEPEYTANTNGHDAAVVLVSPAFARLLAETSFLEGLAKVLSHRGQDRGGATAEFHIVAAVTDRIHQIALSNRIDEGISILRSHRDILLPKLFDSVPPKDKQDADAVSALTFEFPDTGAVNAQSSMTIPLTRTLFLNGKPSTLLTSRFDVSTAASPKLLETTETHMHSVNLPTWTGIDYWAPLLPLTRARTVTESFGNIIREINVEGQGLPASTELEDAIINKLSKIDLNLQSGPVSVFAVVVPESTALDLEKHAPVPDLQHEGLSLKDALIVDQIHNAADYVQQVLHSKGRIFKVCKLSQPSLHETSF